jgi:hypothetical protein
MLIKRIQLFEKYEEEHLKWSSDQLNKFVATLLNREVTILYMPTLGVGGNAIKFEDGPEIKQIKTLMDVIGAKCSKLRLLHIRVDELYLRVMCHQDPILLADVGQSIFMALPRLASLQVLQIDELVCDDWALTQFGMHSQNLV